MSLDQTCRTCRHTTKAPGHGQRYKLGLRNCTWLPAWQFIGGSHACHIGKWQAKSDKPAAIAQA